MTTTVVGDLAFRTICERHHFRPFVGRNVQFALDYYECPTCVAEQDAEDERSRQPCCSRMNIDCCGHGDDEPNMWEVTIKSSNYCNHVPGRVCYYDPCRHRECNEPPF